MDEVVKDIIRQLNEKGYLVHWTERSISIRHKTTAQCMLITEEGVSTNINIFNNEEWELITRLRNKWLSR